MPAAVRKELAVTMDVAFVQVNDQCGSLHDLIREWRNPRHAGRQAVSFRVVFAQTGSPLLPQGFRPRLQRNLSDIPEAGSWIPDTGEIDLTVGCPRRWTSRGRVTAGLSAG